MYSLLFVENHYLQVFCTINSELSGYSKNRNG